MATIHDINSARARVAAEPGNSDGPKGEIVIFPGVRYERWVEPATEPAEPVLRRRLRDRLEIAD